MPKPNPYALADVRRMVESGSVHALRVPNVGKTTRGVNGCWYIFWVYQEDGVVKIQDITMKMARALGYRFSQKSYWLIGHNFNLDGSDIRNDIREALDMPDFNWRVIT
jgi:hypothetical protein